MTPRLDLAHRCLVAVLAHAGLTSIRVPAPEAGPAWHDLAEDGVVLLAGDQPVATVKFQPDHRRCKVRVHRVQLSTGTGRDELVADVRIGPAVAP